MHSNRVTLNQLRYFSIIGRELSFRRAAELLFISQPAISLAVKQLEREIGVQLLVRDTHSVELTEAGKAWLPRIEALLDQADEVVQGMSEWAHGRRGHLRIGYLVGTGSHLLARFLTDYEALHPDITVEAIEFDFSDPTAGLASDKVDVAIIRPPVELAGIDMVLFEDESWVACLPRRHRFATRESLSITELLDEPIIAAPESAGSWRDYWIAMDARGGRPPNVAGISATYEAEFTAVSRGTGISFTTSGAAQYYHRPGIVFVPIIDREAVHAALAWPRDRFSGAVPSFVAHVRNDIEETDSHGE